MTPVDLEHGDCPPRRGRPPSGGREAILAATVGLLREKGASRLTTREVATRAGVSEGSVFYHFGDRSGLLTAVITQGCQSFGEMESTGQPGDVGAALDRITATLDEFLDTVLVAMIAAQSDAELRTAMADHFLANNLGPHRGIEGLSALLQHAQSAGLVRRDLDPDSLAMLVISSCFLRASMVQMIGADYATKLPDRKQLLGALTTLLAPLPE